MAEQLVPTAVVAERLGVSAEAVRKMFITHPINGDEPVPIRLSNQPNARLRWSMSEVEAWIERSKDRQKRERKSGW